MVSCGGPHRGGRARGDSPENAGYPLFIHTLAGSFANGKELSHLFSMNSKQFGQNTGVDEEQRHAIRPN